ncbi:MAG: hypothetical protein A3G52_02140 [Candidatus Taylorbacteria bacterium RIFCSPLOWO2_12_FULL_43_20]|uniref:Uncharacterized protein n=1 Tax=Candidatus Taylorbacteria bacterium RIFCSPLOWO2_12_FULL_43_20 TaxID=1802332 RepID=A0A1G2P2Y0_9BACT|nr:MAG: hypothetical protein A2825_01025 [Candidatus Taylorbacteria bacterium RIFCSPHIGHO2_01_FULL_43_120]OHA23578.1 MAG: hypothetical protein A3B98_00470 [Candidatus Taylorbacteria bacterium RIFCSPHIGHO2_02_FULL_43_55]OHA28887.1 MAG: hypothetical protein A3E92_04405 [Candidatus Taylorbacteria bacterium RIFCSPHIGHO2_12_FULL_42_34]OHA30283.1 MAG: hypothetical protein A3B09_03940 [Candidatus Taylorbacteria bacterium RIFCSPLOWO2_01_FULL_43_83]OHA39335.1 MAG: hypothetical protein A3H58_04105 [Candi
MDIYFVFIIHFSIGSTSSLSLIPSFILCAAEARFERRGKGGGLWPEDFSPFLFPSLEGKCRVCEAMGCLLLFFVFVSIPDASVGAPTEASKSYH